MEIISLRSSLNRLTNFLEFRHIPFVIKSAIEVSFFEILFESEKTLEEIIAEAHTDELRTKYVLEILTCIGLLLKKDDKYTLNVDAKEFLCKKSETEQTFRFKNLIDENSPYKNLTEVLKKEFEPKRAGKNWSERKLMEEMRQASVAGAQQDLYNFAFGIPYFRSMTKMCDLGGNSGYYSMPFLDANRTLESHVFDMPEVCKQAELINKDDNFSDRIFFHQKNLDEDFNIGDDYDIVLASHFLYRKNTDNLLDGFFYKVNKALKLGGVFVSNHFGDNLVDDGATLMALMNLRTSLFGLKSHQIPRANLEASLSKNGFANFAVCEYYVSQKGFHTMVFSAEKVAEV